MHHQWLQLTPADLRVEKEQLGDEGRDLSSIASDLDALIGSDPNQTDFQARALELLERGQDLPLLPGYEFDEPSDLESIRAARPDGPRQLSGGLPDKDLADRVHAAWLGRCCGNLLGKPIEGWLKDRIWGFLAETGNHPLHQYLRSDVPDETRARFDVDPALTFINNVTCSPEDDDLNYTVTGLVIWKKQGSDFKPADVATFWLENIPILRTYTAERVAYRNFIEGIAPPHSASVRNPYREWIGAQIRADFWGYIALGNPERAAEYAWRDASISHIKNGIYGEMWVAAMTAAAPFVSSPVELLNVGLSEIPARSRLTRDIQEVMGWKSDGVSYEDAVARIHQRWDDANPHHWCHTNSNTQIVALGLLWGEQDFGVSICRAVQACFDTDCNGATVGSLFGLMHGLQSIPAPWTDPLHDTLETSLQGYSRVRISDMAAESFRLYSETRST